MFVFKSDDLENPWQRERRYKIELIKYALKIHKDNRTQSAEYLNVSKRTLLKYIGFFPELHKYRRKPSVPKNQEQYYKKLAMYERYK